MSFWIINFKIVLYFSAWKLRITRCICWRMLSCMLSFEWFWPPHHSDCANFINLFLLKKSFWLTVKSKINRTYQLIFSDKSFPHQGNLFQLSILSRQPVGLSVVFVLLEFFSQTSCLMPLIKSFFKYSRLERWKKRLRALVVAFPRWYFLSWFLFPFMEVWMSGKKLKIIATYFLPLFHLHGHNQIDALFAINSDYSVKLLILKRLCSIETTKLRLILLAPQLREPIMPLTRRHLRVVHCIFPNAPFSPQNPNVFWFIILLKTQGRKIYCSVQL